MRRKKPIEWVETPNGCYEVISHALDNHGYPRFWKNGRSEKIHRHIFEQCFGDLGEYHVLHTCDNPKCINPLHLVKGTHLDNMKDRNLKGRSKSGLSGAKIDEETAKKIRQLFKSGVKQKDLAQQFNLSKGTISLIVNKKIWSHA